ncbi:hypothetical protein HYZ97_01525 [Candidatus Pacearchaeota archaeon]|nr:hypothetical protein [Candidatus Pacearchaeota archaeon]
MEKEMYEWCLIEYKHISQAVGKKNLWFTNIPKKDRKKLAKYGSVFTESVTSMHLKNACVLDPEANKLLSPRDKSRFQYFILGGILGDDPPQKRTGPELSRFLPEAVKRHIGDRQMSTDNAVYTAQQILRGKAFRKLAFIDTAEVTINKVESILLPYRYNLVHGKSYISPKLIHYLKKKESF